MGARPGSARRGWYVAAGLICAVAGLALAWAAAAGALRAAGVVAAAPSEPRVTAPSTIDRDPAGTPSPAGAPPPRADPIPPVPPPVPPPPAAGPSRETAAGPRPSPTSVEAPLAGTVLVVDPGHNGGNARHAAEVNRPVDAGGFTKACNTVGAATDDGYPEAAFAWATALELRARLEALGARVVLTRDDDEGWGPCVDERGLTAARVDADLLLSIHADGAPPGGRGFHVIRPDVVAGYTDAVVAPSAVLAGHVRDALVTVAGLTPSTYLGRDGIDVRRDLGTLNRAGVPALMVECGNLRNAQDAALLTSPAGRARITDALTAAVVEYRRAGAPR